jgi:hypothetical protein
MVTHGTSNMHNNMCCSSMHPRVECIFDSGRLMQDMLNDPSSDSKDHAYLRTALLGPSG